MTTKFFRHRLCIHVKVQASGAIDGIAECVAPNSVHVGLVQSLPPYDTGRFLVTRISEVEQGLPPQTIKKKESN